MLGVHFYLCEVTLSLRRAVFPIYDFRNVVTLKTGLGVRQGYWKCHHSIQRITHTIDVLLTMALFHVVSEISSVE